MPMWRVAVVFYKAASDVKPAPVVEVSIGTDAHGEAGDASRAPRQLDLGRASSLALPEARGGAWLRPRGFDAGVRQDLVESVGVTGAFLAQQLATVGEVAELTEGGREEASGRGKELID